jgi:cysteine-rich repeat protein
MLPTCGDGILDPGETCDPPGLPQPPNGNDCQPSCTYCGDGITQAPEQCDDGNSDGGDGCRNDCTIPVCGDGILDPGETCEPPGSPAGPHGYPCRMDCTVCGDAVTQPGGSCDDGNTVDADACSNLCTTGLNHFVCYEAHADPAVISGVSLSDELYPASTVDVIELRRLCAPADKMGEDPTAPSDPDHLAGYKIKQTAPATSTIVGQTIVNQFGTFVVQVKKPEYLLVPSAKGLAGPPPPLAPAAIDHFKCYKVVKGKFKQDGVAVIDQFQTLSLDVKKPLRLCVPADKNGEGILNAETHLTCFKARDKTDGFTPPGTVFIDNQFTGIAGQPSTFDLFRVTELCLPTALNP